MADKKQFFVDGGILVNTPFFRYENAGAGFGEGFFPDAQPLATNRKSRESGKYLLIDDNNPQSIFAEYYARTFFTTGYCWAPMFCKTYDDCEEEFRLRIKEVEKLLSLSETIDSKGVKNLLLRLSIVQVISAMDTFIADIILTKITNDEASFYKYAFAFDLKEEKDKVISPKAEQKVIEGVLRRPFMKKQNIQEAFNVLFGVDLKIGKDVEDLITTRNLLVHRCGRKKDGSYVEYSLEDVGKVIQIVEGFVKQVLGVIRGCPS